MRRNPRLIVSASGLVPVAALMILLTVGGCADGGQRHPEAVATIQPVSLIVGPVLGTDVRVLLSPGASPHTYDPRPSDARAAATARYLFFASEHLDGWAARLSAREKIGLLALVPDSLLLKHHIAAAGPHRAEADPHFWMDPLTVRSILPSLADTLCAHEPEGCEWIRSRSDAFAATLAEVDDSLSIIMSNLEGTTVLLSHPFLGYFGRRYGLSIGGILEEIPGSEPTPRDMQRMIEHARAADARAIITLPQHPSRAAAAVAEETDLPIVELDPIGAGADTYAELLYFNARKIRDAVADSTRTIDEIPGSRR